MEWNDTDNLISRDDAIVKIKAKAGDLGYQDYKVFYDGDMVVRPNDLPERVDMELVSIGQKADQA